MGMEIYGILEELKQRYGLRKNDILIIQALLEKDLTAEQICEQTKIPMGRIYTFLNALLPTGLIEKKSGTPACYSAQNIEERILNFLMLKREEMIKKEDDIIARLERIKKLENVKTLVGPGDLNDFLIQQMAADRKYSKQISVAGSVPFI